MNPNRERGQQDGPCADHEPWPHSDGMGTIRPGMHVRVSAAAVAGYGDDVARRVAVVIAAGRIDSGPEAGVDVPSRFLMRTGTAANQGIRMEKAILSCVDMVNGNSAGVPVTQGRRRNPRNHQVLLPRHTPSRVGCRKPDLTHHALGHSPSLVTSTWPTSRDRKAVSEACSTGGEGKFSAG